MANTAPHNPPFRAEHIGSLLRPPELLKARTDNEDERLADAELRKIEDEHIRKVVALQEEVGLQSITDGEYRRSVFYTDFASRGLKGASVYYESERMFFVDDQNNKIAVPLLRIDGPLRWTEPIHADEFKFTQSLTKGTVKMTLPSPTAIYSVDGRNVSTEAYTDLNVLRADLVDAYQKELPALAAVGCRYVQLDEVPIAMYCDPKRREQMTASGHDVDDILFNIFPNLINDALANHPKSIHVAMHLCRGNNQSGWLTEGATIRSRKCYSTRSTSIPTCWSTTPRAPAASRRCVSCPSTSRWCSGIVSSKLPQLESKDDLKRRIDEAAKYIDLDQLGISPQCGFASTAPGNKLTPDEQWAKLAAWSKSRKRLG